MSKIQRVLIIGGGISGLTAAISLKRRGIDADVVEQNAAWSVYGVGIIQPSNALRALNSIGLGQACVANGQGFRGWRLNDSNGGFLAEVPSINVAGHGFPPINGIARPALHKILTDATLDQGTKVRLGQSVSSWSDETSGIRVTFTNGESESYDLVIGADGAYSRTRASLFGKDLKLKFTGASVWRHNFQRPRDMEWGSLFYGKTSKAGLVPLSDTQMYLFLVTAEPGNPKHPPDQLHTLLRDRLQEYGGAVGQLRAQVVDPAAVVYRPLEIAMVPAPWHKGRVVLIGDAAHSSTPHLAEGAAMAIEDSVLLAEMLQESTVLDATLTAFTARRLPRARLVYETGLKLVDWELAEWAGHPDPNADHGALIGEALGRLMEPH